MSILTFLAELRRNINYFAMDIVLMVLLYLYVNQHLSKKEKEKKIPMTLKTKYVCLSSSLLPVP